MTLPYTFWNDLDIINERRDDPTFDPDTGISREELYDACLEIAKDSTKSKVIRKAEAVALMLDRARLEISPHDLFCDRLDRKLIMDDIKKLWFPAFDEIGGDILRETAEGQPLGAFDGNADFGHTCPDYDSLISLGIPGIIARLEEKLTAADEDKREFYEASLIAYRAFRRLLIRFSEAYAKHAGESKTAAAVSEICAALAEREPETLAEVLELIALYQRTQHHVEGTITRTVGRLDVLIEPFYEAGCESDEVLLYFLNRMNDIFFYANIPFTLCGEDIAGNQKLEAIALRILELHEMLGNPSPKIQIRVGEHTPRTVIEKACSMIRNGCNSIVFCNDPVVVESFIKNGHSPEDAMNYVMIGCYEPSTMGCEVSCTCAGNVVLPKAVETALNRGRDLASDKQLGPECPAEYSSFEEFYREVKRQAVYFAEQSMRRIKALELGMMEVSPSPLFSGSMESCVESGKDAYAGGAKYNFTSVNVFGIANAADSVYAVKKLVFDDKTLSIPDLREILKNNWEGNEKLRLTVKNKFPKYGSGIDEVDTIAAELMSVTVNTINGKPNARNGHFRAGAFSVDSRFPYGQRCAASADGRLAGEPLSKNMAASDGVGKFGVTSMIESATRIDYTDIPNGTVLDVVLHKTAVAGDDGLCALMGLVYTFLKKGGFAIQVNVLDPEVLREAQKDPESYRNLQVRLCGWNVHFVDLKKYDQDSFIEMSEA